MAQFKRNALAGFPAPQPRRSRPVTPSATIAGGAVNQLLLDGYLVRNIDGTSQRHDCPCGGWLRHWERHAGHRALVCAVVGCTSEPTDGAHVGAEGLVGEWILPMCRRHNLASDTILTRRSIKPVPAGVAEACRQ